MKLLFLCKRRPMGRDLVERPYGRFHHLPLALAARGHEVTVLVASYRRDPPLDLERDGVRWMSRSVLPLGPLPYLACSRELAQEGPDWIIGLSDTWYGITAHRLARRFGSHSAIDAYDNYEAYIPWLKPLHGQWRRALAEADLVTAAGPRLATLMSEGRARPGIVLSMAADPQGFHPLDRRRCRAALGLPETGRLVGYCGALYRNRGIDVLFEAYRRLREQDPSIELVLTGRRERSVGLPPGARWLGYLPDEQVPAVLNAMDLLVVINRRSAFGEHSHPVKLYEAMRCGVPVIASETAATRWILGGFPELLVEPENAAALAARIPALLERGRIDYGPQPSWQETAAVLEAALLEASGRRACVPAVVHNTEGARA